ncbi:Wzz/FepE/Etk N-terminal domain-containing protein, partial [Flavobacterium sp.]|uniref:Wzz/FepE/Etk N-terminal domain-containing protein n=1 Tax=Flavobacterium sp. TaxID=239 RepID=UPI00262EC738
MQIEEKNSNNQESQFDLKRSIYTYLSKWPWFIVGVLVCLSCAFVYLRYTIPSYSASAIILVKDDKKGGMVSELAALSEVDLMGNIKSTVDNEIEIIKSRTIAESAVRDLNLNIKYKREGRVKTVDLYSNSPISVILADKDAVKNSHKYKVEYTGGNNYSLLDEEENKIGSYKFGEPVKHK